MSVLWAKLENLWTELPHSRSGSLYNFSIRLLLLPLFLALELVALPWRIARDEPFDYQLTRDGRRPSRELSGVKIHLSRFTACWEVSPALWFQAVLYVVLLDLFAALGVQHVVRNFRPEIEYALASVTGAFYETKDGLKFATSPSSSDTEHHLKGGHSLGQHSALCPAFGSAHPAPVDCPCRAFFLVACCKLSYEVQPIIQDVLTSSAARLDWLRRWGLQLVAYENVPADLYKGCDYVPDMVWFAAAGPRGLVIAFTGAQLFNKIDRGTDIPCAMSEYRGCGRMTDGMVRGLMRQSLNGGPIFARLKSILRSHATGSSEIFLTGHSLGGALAATFAQMLAAEEPELADSITGIFTFGAPRAGDAAFVRLLRRRFEGRLFRYVHAADMICKLPHSFQGVPFQHHCGERFISSFAVPGASHRVLKEEESPKLMRDLETREDRLAHLFSLAKLLSPATQSRGCGFGARLLMLLLPGVADHFPAEYCEGVQQLLVLCQPQSPRAQDSGMSAHLANASSAKI